MKSYVVLLRGINVGGKNILPMKELAALMEGLGFKDVRTYIQSGNVVLRSAARPHREIGAGIGEAIETRYGFRPGVFVMGSDALAEAHSHNPFANLGKQVHFFFYDAPPPQPDIERIEKLKAESEQYAITERVFYLYAPEGIGRSKLAAAAEKCLGVSVTARNLNTVAKLLRLMEG